MSSTKKPSEKKLGDLVYDGIFSMIASGEIAENVRLPSVGFEAGAAGLAAISWRAQEMAELESAVDELSQALSKGELAVDADSRFHRAVAAATRNTYYISVQNSLDQNIRFGMNLALNLSLLKPAARNKIVVVEHAEIVEAIRQRDAISASQAMARHIENARKRMFEGCETP